MQAFSDYEIAQRRIVERQRKTTQFRTSIFFAVVPLVITLISHEMGICLIPLAVIAGIFVLANGIELYYAKPEHAPSEADIEQETRWLFGNERDESLSAQAYAFAHERIRKRLVSRWRFAAHFLIYMPINGWIIVNTIQDPFSPTVFIFVVIVAWFVILVAHAVSTFPTPQQLEKRETKMAKCCILS